MSNVNDISDQLLTKSIREILESADLNVMTSKLVRNELKIKLNVEDLDSRKKQINSIINDVINELNKRKDKPNKDIKTEIIIKTNIDKSEEKPKNKKSKDSDESEDSSSDDSLDNEDINDEQLARKLHKEELNSKLRKSTKSRSSTKRSKSEDKKSNKKKSEDKPKKKGGNNGYMKSLALSPEMAEFLGESEMPRHEVVKRIWSYVKEKNLFDPKNKQFAICDNQMIKIFGRKRVRMFGMMKFLGKHFI